jgi:hypothetical protein
MLCDLLQEKWSVLLIRLASGRAPRTGNCGCGPSRISLLRDFRTRSCQGTESRYPLSDCYSPRAWGWSSSPGSSPFGRIANFLCGWLGHCTLIGRHQHSIRLHPLQSLASGADSTGNERYAKSLPTGDSSLSLATSGRETDHYPDCRDDHRNHWCGARKERKSKPI